MATKATPPTEQQEQEAFVAWCRLQGYKVHHSPNEVGGNSNQMKLRAIKMKKMGTSKGFPDLLVFVPFAGIDDEVDAYQPIAIEMKRTKGSTTSPEQKVWGDILEKSGIPFRICKGCEEAITAVKEIIGGLEDEI